jgi:hypothetical protein
MKNKIPSIILLVTLACIIAFFSLSYIFTPDKGFSEDENRVLQGAPRFTVEKLLDGTYTRQLHDYFSDQINFRTAMINLKASIELAMGKNENNDILLGKDGYLIETHQYTEDNYSYLKRNLLKIENMMQSLKENEVTVHSAIIPRKVDILQSKLPPYYSDNRNKEIWNLVSDQHINLTDILLKRQGMGNDIFYKTDHHWTADGAYYAYAELITLFGSYSNPKSFFELELLSDSFYGTSYSKSGFFFASADSIFAPKSNIERYTTTIVDTGIEFDGFYDTDYLSKKDKYSVFLSGNNAHVKITDKEDNNKETLLIVKDSFSHSLAPYLCEHYNLELIDPRYYIGSIEEYILENDIKNVLFIFGLDTLASANISIR